MYYFYLSVNVFIALCTIHFSFSMLASIASIVWPLSLSPLRNNDRKSDFSILNKRKDG